MSIWTQTYSKTWNEKFISFLPALGFESNHSDPSLFLMTTRGYVMILVLYVDHIILIGDSDSDVQCVMD